MARVPGKHVPMYRRKVMKAGAVEFLTKPFQKEEMLAAVYHAFEIDHTRRSEQRELAIIRSRLATLTPRELEVMDYVTTGALNKQIAAALEPQRDYGSSCIGGMSSKRCMRIRSPTWSR